MHPQTRAAAKWHREMKVPQTLLGSLSFFLSGAEQSPALAPAQIDPDLYMGRWYVLACTANPAEAAFVDAVETYTLTGDRKVDVLFEWKNKDPAAPVQQHRFRGRLTSHPGVWKMRLFPFLSVTYVVLAVGSSYAWAAVAHPSRKFGWVLARQPQMTDAEWQKAFSALAAAGYDTQGLRRVQQSPANSQ